MMKKNRRKARALALQALYQWLMTGEKPAAIKQHLGEQEDFTKIDEAYFDGLVEGATQHAAALDQMLSGCVDRPVTELSPVEHAILLVAAEELQHRLDVPYRVVINEAVELAKQYGGTDGYKFVNGVLDKLAVSARAVEVAAARRT